MSSKAKEHAIDQAVQYLTKEIEALLENKPQVILGVGTGSTVALIMKKLKQDLISNSLYEKDGMEEDIKTGNNEEQETKIDPKKRRRKQISLHSVICIPTSEQSKDLIREIGFIIGSLNQFSTIDIGFDGADEVDSSGRYLIKGGGGALLMEKIIAMACKKWIIIVEESKINLSQTSTESEDRGIIGSQWKKGIPIVVLPESIDVVNNLLKKIGLGAHYRTGTGKIGPVISDQGHLIMDVHKIESFPNPSIFTDLSNLSVQLSLIPGILEHGLFIDLATQIIIGHEDCTDEQKKEKCPCTILHPIRKC